MASKDIIKVQKSSLYRLGYTIPLCTLFLYFSKNMLLALPTLWIPGAVVSEDLLINFKGDDGKPYLSGYSDFNKIEFESLNLDFCRFQQNDARNGCLEEAYNQRIKVSMDESGEDGVTCHKVRREGLRCVNQLVKDCYKLGTSHWYGGFEALTQLWPLKKGILEEEATIIEANDAGQPKTGVELTMAPYIGGDFGMHKTNLLNVLDTLFISSSGVGLYVSKESPLHLSFNQHGDGKICMAAMYDNVHYFSQNRKPPVLEYTVCKAADVKAIYKYMSGRFIGRPKDIPNRDLLTRPIWSTWAQYNKDINQSAVLDFAEKIIANDLPFSNLEIDDKWMTQYGDLVFDQTKFPNVKTMMQKLTAMGFPVALWVHTFIGLNSKAFPEAVKNKYLIMSQGSTVPALVKWWNEDMAGVLDVTNPAAVLWFQKKLWHLQEHLNITSFKFDSGEGLFFPRGGGHSTFAQMTSPNEYSSLWAELAHSVDSNGRRQEVRVGWNSQHLPITVRLMDRLSTWGQDGGLQSLIPSVLTLGLIGYPFILPDMIGGNAYADMETFRGGAYPNKELYVRWMQTSLFMPTLQLSIVPWLYGDKVTESTRQLLKLREEYAPTFVALAEESVRTGNPIVRPLWWLAPDDENALVVNDEFLVGDDLLVAPVVVEGARKRDIYILPGVWEDKLRGGQIEGPVWLKDYPAGVYELPFFQRIEV